MVRELRQESDIPTYVGIGVSTPDQARETAVYSDGVIVGSALGEDHFGRRERAEVETFVRSFRRALDRVLCELFAEKI